MQEVTGARHGDLHQRTSPDVVDRLFKRSRCPLSDDELQAIADHMNWVEQPLDPSSDSKIPSGYTVLGQFITHDLSFNTTPLSGSPDPRNPPVGQRTPQFDLDSIYAPSPFLGVSPPIHSATGEMWYRASQGPDEADDLPRWVDLKDSPAYANLHMPNGEPIPDEQAIIGDIRNDENVLIGQLHLAFLKLHNVFVKHFRESALGSSEMSATQLFNAARRRCQWYYQWVVVNDFLPRIVGQDMIDSIMTTRYQAPPELRLTLYETSKIRPPIIPVEFTVAAFRFGHSMVRAQYRVNAAGIPYPLFGASDRDGRHLGGGRRLPAALVVDWARFFTDLPAPPELADPNTFTRNFARKIDTRLNELLAKLPPQALPQHGDSDIKSLALRDLKRAVKLEMPSGQEVAAEICSRVPRFRALSDEALGLDELGLERSAPLWFYVLREAECARNIDSKTGEQHGPGEQLGPVGGRIVAEVILGLLGCHKESYFNQGPDFTDFQPTINGEPIRGMADLLRLADAKFEATP